MNGHFIVSCVLLIGNFPVSTMMPIIVIYDHKFATGI